MALPHRMSTVVVLMLAVVAMLMEVGGSRQPRQGRRTKRGNDMCSSNSVAEYKLTFYGAWSKEKFPRMYPTSRPHAQWSKLVGRTHDKSHQMWSEGNTSSLAFKKFAEEEDSELLEMQVQGYDGVYDTFSCEPLARGEGKTSTVILADGTHSKVSFVVRLIPSPDWFVGVDGLDLCQNGRWRQKVSVNLRPYDAGTDQGITFTAPNYPSHPLQPVQKITAFFPSHMASPFYYPEYRKLPRIAHAEMQLVAQYLRRGAASSHKPNELTAEPVDCRVTEWSEWGPCSKTCGYGQRVRSRRVLSHARNGGSVCPLLQQQELCGGMSTCNWKHFDSFSQKMFGTGRRQRFNVDHRAQQG
ncbi:spondin-2-like isoform X2 [Pomacea canaliculata]|uniref:spondin-2-like isoform X2 n=1 Tax=Pomacea canaliculata TaxID=400727 RepID=UPI000D73C656|nr:spondin-2-like isoform X2 [Pomacea canaliculata]